MTKKSKAKPQQTIGIHSAGSVPVPFGGLLGGSQTKRLQGVEQHAYTMWWTNVFTGTLRTAETRAGARHSPPTGRHGSSTLRGLCPGPRCCGQSQGTSGAEAARARPPLSRPGTLLPSEILFAFIHAAPFQCILIANSTKQKQCFIRCWRITLHYRTAAVGGAVEWHFRGEKSRRTRGSSILLSTWLQRECYYPDLSSSFRYVRFHSVRPGRAGSDSRLLLPDGERPVLRQTPSATLSHARRHLSFLRPQVIKSSFNQQNLQASSSLKHWNLCSN